MIKEKILSFINNPKLKHISETIYIVIFCLYFYNVCSSDRIIGFSFVTNISNFLFSFLPFIVLLQWLTHLDRKRDIFIGLALIVLWKFLTIYNPNGLGTISWAFLMAASIGVDYKKVLKICVPILGITIFSSLVVNTITGGGVVYADTARIRSDGGVMGYPTDSASLVLYFCIFAFVTAEYETDYIALLLAASSFAASAFYFESNTSQFMSLLLMAMIVYSRIEVRFWKKKPIKIISAVINVFALTAVPVLTVFLLICSFFYGEGSALMAKLSSMLHHRIMLTWNALDEYGIKPFGVAIELVGAAVPGMRSVNYNFIDSSYINILVRYGVIVAIVILLMWTFIVYMGMSGRRRRLVLASIIIAIHSFEEHHFFEMIYNPIFWMPLAYGVNRRFESYGAYLRRKNEKREKSKKIFDNRIMQWVMDNRDILIANVVRLVVIFVLFLLMPQILMRFRTLVDINQRISKGLLITQIITCVFFMCVLIFVYFAGRVAAEFVLKKGILGCAVNGGKDKEFVIGNIRITLSYLKNSVVIAMTAAVFAIIIFFGAGLRLHFYQSSFAIEVESDADAIKLILENAQYPVYSDMLPEFYYKKYKGLKVSPFTGADTVRQLNCTVITDADNNCIQLFNRGALYGVISETTAIYTTDKAVYEALYSAGYHVRGYYYSEQEVEFEYEYVSSSLPVTAGNLYLTGSMTFTSANDNNSEGKAGNDIDGEIASSTLIGRLSVESENGEELIKKVYYRDFDENGNYSYNLRFNTKCENVTVRFDINYGKEVQIGECSIVTEGEEAVVEVPLNCELSSDKEAIYAGKYELTTVLSSDRLGGVDTSESVGTLTYTTNMNKNVTKTIYVSEFVDGKVTITMPLLSTAEYYNFTINTDGKYMVKLDSCTYVAKPDYDTHVTYNDDGYAIRTEYYDIEGNKTTSKEGYFALENDYDEEGHIIRTSYYDMDDQLMIVSGGYAEVRTTYNNLGFATSISYFGEEDVPIMVDTGYWKVTYELDTYGRQLVTRYYDTDGNPVAISSGYAEVHRDYDSNNRVIYEAYYDENGDRVNMPQGYSAVRTEYDERGNRAVVIYLDEEDESVMTTWGYAEVHREYDENNRVTVETYYGTAGEIMETEAGYATMVKEYDADGNNIAIRYFGLDASEGYTEIIREFDTKNRIVYEAKKNSDGEFIILSGQYCAYRKTYDENSNVDTIVFYGTDGEVVLIGGEYAEVHYQYDESNRVIYEAFFDGYGNGVTRGAGYHACGYEYDANNNRSVVRYYDLNDKLMLLGGEYAENHKEYDENKRLVADSYYGLSGEKVLLNAGYHMISYGYDEENNVNVLKYYDTDGNPTLISSGVHEIHRTFNEVKKIIREEYYGTDGNPIANTAGAAVVTREYYDDGSLIAEYKYDIDGNLITE